MVVLKLDERGREVFRYPVARVLEQAEDFICIEAFFGRDDVDLGYTIFRKGDRFVEYFYSDRWYNIFAVYKPGGGFKGWYCNICRAATWGNGEIRCEDLALDVWIDPDGRVLLLDEEEFDGLEITAVERKQALAAVETLKMLSGQNRLPR